MSQRQFKSSDTSAWVFGYGNGSDGALSISADTTEAPIDSACTATGGTTSISATNASFATGQIILVHQTRGTGAGTWELNRILSYSAGTITTALPVTNNYVSGAQVRVLKQYSSVTVDSGKTYTAKAWDGTVGGIIGFLCSGSVTITGSINATGKGYRGGSGAVSAGQAFSGEGTTGASTAQTANQGNGAGGSVGQDCAGSGGGNGTAGSQGTKFGGTFGTVGSTAGSADLVTLVFGGGGGGGCENNGSPNPGVGGNGGGIVFIVCNSYTVSGSVVSGGTNGGTPGVASNNVASGGGAGGSILMKAKSATLGTNLITTPAGAGGVSNYSGGSGGVGRIHLDYLYSFTGSTTPSLDSTLDGILSGGSSSSFFISMLL